MTTKDWRIALVLVLVGTGLGSCYEDDRYRYLSHSDTITLGAGNANAVNAATQTIDPWPPESKENRIDMDGKRAHIAVKRYETNTSIEPKGLSTSTASQSDSGDSGAPAVDQ